MTTTHLELLIDGMHCGSCGLLVDETLEELDGVTHCATDVRRGRAQLTFDATRITVDDITTAITALGYHAAAR
jgi:copper chaperone